MGWVRNQPGERFPGAKPKAQPPLVPSWRKPPVAQSGAAGSEGGGLAPVAAAPAAGAAASEGGGLAPAPALEALRRWACCGNVYGKDAVACASCGTAAPPEGERPALPKPRVEWASEDDEVRYDPEEAPAAVLPKKRPKRTDTAEGNLPPYIVIAVQWGLHVFGGFSFLNLRHALLNIGPRKLSFVFQSLTCCEICN